MPAFAPAACPPQPRLQLGEGHVQRREAVLGRGLGADHRTAGGDGELDAFPAARLTRVSLRGYLHIDPDRLAVESRDLAQLGCCVPAEPFQHVRVPALEDDVHEGTPFCPVGENGTRPADLVFDPTSAC